MKIAIIGATGDPGRHFLDQALAEGHAVTALARAPEKLKDYECRVNVVRADGRDLPSLFTALKPGFDAVVSIVGASSFSVADRAAATTPHDRQVLARRNAGPGDRLGEGSSEHDPRASWTTHDLAHASGRALERRQGGVYVHG